jgi:hypothetical protein
VTPPPHQIVGKCCSQLHGVGSALSEAATLMAEIRDELPKRGTLVDLYIELGTTLEHLENAYHDADETLVDAYAELEHAERAAREGWTPHPLNGTA